MVFQFYTKLKRASYKEFNSTKVRFVVEVYVEDIELFLEEMPLESATKNSKILENSTNLTVLGVLVTTYPERYVILKMIQFSIIFIDPKK